MSKEKAAADYMNTYLDRIAIVIKPLELWL